MSTTPTPKPTPKPGMPTPGAMPGAKKNVARSTPSPVPAVTPVDSNPRDFGRISEDGTVYLRTSEGEREIGSWQAGTVDEGFAHFGDRFQDLVTEVELLEARIAAHPEDAQTLRKQAEDLKETLPTQAVLGDVDALDKRLADVIEFSVKAGEQAKADKQARREQAIARKEALAAEAESLAENSTEWKAAGDRIRAILDEWRGIRGIDRKTDDELWKRYSRARDSFNRRRGAHFAELDRGRATAKAKKEEIIERAEALSSSTDWNKTARAYRDLMAEWKAAGRAQRDTDDKLWARFRAAQDVFFNAREEANAQRDQEFEANAAAKDKLIEEYDEQINPSQNLDAARAKLRELQDKWEEIGYVPRAKVREYEEKIGALETRVTDAEEARWRSNDPEAQARAQAFQVRADEFLAQAEDAETKGNTKKAEDLRAQAQQWQQFAEAARNAIS